MADDEWPDTHKDLHYPSGIIHKLFGKNEQQPANIFIHLLLLLPARKSNKQRQPASRLCRVKEK
jgi:hypothetical protein